MDSAALGLRDAESHLVLQEFTARPDVHGAATGHPELVGSMSNSSITDADSSSLGILSVGNLSDFSVMEAETHTDTVKFGSSKVPFMYLHDSDGDVHSYDQLFDLEASKKNFSNIIGQTFSKILDFNQMDFNERLQSLFGDKSEEIKQILDCPNDDIEREEIVETNSVSRSVNQDGTLATIDVMQLNNGNERPKKSSTAATPLKDETGSTMFKACGSEPDTPFTKFMKAAPCAISDETVDDSAVNSFGEKSSFEVEKFYQEKLSSQSNSIVFCDDQISARSSPLNRVKDAVYSSHNTSEASLLQKTFMLNNDSSLNGKEETTKCSDTFSATFEEEWGTRLAYDHNFLEDAGAQGLHSFEENCELLNLSDEDFLSKEDGLKMIQDDQERFEKAQLFETGINDSKFSQCSSNWSVSNQPLGIDPPSWWSEVNCSSSEHQISIGQLIAARTENLGDLSNNLQIQRPFFGTPVISPPRKENVSTLSENISFAAADGPKEESSERTRLNSNKSMVSLSTISEALADISLQDAPSVIVSKFFDKESQKATKIYLDKGKRCNSSFVKAGFGNLCRTALCDEMQNSEQAIDKKFNLQSDNLSYGAATNSETLMKNCKPKEQMDSIVMSNNGSCNVVKKPVVLTSMKKFSEDVNSCYENHENCLKYGLNSQNTLHHPSSFSAVSLESYDNTQHHFVPDVPAELPQLSLDNVLNANSVNSPSDTESSDSSTKTNSTFSKMSCSSRCCQHYQPVSCCQTNSLYSVACPFSRTPNFHNRFPVGSNCVSNVKNFNEPLPIACCIPSGLLNLPFASQALPYTCSTGLSGSIGNLNLAATFPPPQLYPGSMQSYSLPLTYRDAVATTCVKGPSELKFPSACVGDTQIAILTLQNPTVTPLFYHLRLDSATQNNSPLPLDLTGISFVEVVQAIGLSPVNIKLSYTPKFPAEMEAALHIVASHSAVRDVSHSTVGSPLVVKLFLQSENPRVNLSCKSKNIVEFQSVMEDSSIFDILTMENLGGSPVPLKVTIEECGNMNHNFNFAMQDLNVPFNQLEVQKCSYMAPKVIFCKLDGSSSAPDKNKLTIPINFAAGKCQKGGKAESVSAVVTAVLDSSVMHMPLATVQLSATVGTVCLCVKQKIKGPFVLKAAKNSKVSKNVTLVNNGHISVTADLAILSESNCFTVTPPTVKIEPQSEMKITINFEPLSHDPSQGVLQAAPPNQSKVFDLVKVHGEILNGMHPTSWQHRTSLQPTVLRDSLAGFSENHITVESNKKSLTWGGVAVGEVVMKVLNIRNPSDKDVFRAKAVINENCQAYKLIDDTGSQKVSSMDLVLKPKMHKQIKVVFCPQEKKTFISRLSLKPLLLENRACFSIPLSGYGGVSDVKIVNLLEQDGSMGYILHLNSGSESGIVFSNFVVHNIGHRAAFLKILCIKGESMDAFDEEPKISVQPSEFILLEQENKTVQVTYKLDLGHICHTTEKIGKILIYFGDEIMRQKMRKCCNENFSLSQNNPLKNISFDQHYIGEETVPCDESLFISPRDLSLFYNSLKKIIVNAVLTLDGVSFSQMSSFSALSLMQDSIYKDIVETAENNGILYSSSSPIKGPVSNFSNKVAANEDCSSSVASHNMERSNSVSSISSSTSSLKFVFNNANFDSDKDQFSIEPQNLKLDTDNRDARLVIISHSEAEMRFKLTWSVNFICVSPVQGLIPAKGKMGLRVKVLSHFDGKERNEDYEGFISVHCGNRLKYVPVKICVASLKNKHCNKAAKNLLTLDNITAVSENFLQRNEKKDHDKVISNSYSSPSLCSHKTTGIRRMSVDAHLVPELSDFQIPTKERRSEVLSTDRGTFLKDAASTSSSEESNTRSSSHKGVPHHSRKCISSFQNSLIVEPEMIDFSVAKPGEKATSLVTLKNPENKSHQVTIETPELPFVIKRLSFTIKPNFFVTFPIHFCPKSPSLYRGTLSLQSDNGCKVKIPMKGSCVL